MKLILTVLAIICVTVSYTQGVIDSLKRIYPRQVHAEKALTLGELCYQLAYNDAKAAIKYGRMGYEAAKQTNNDTLIAQLLNDWSIPYLIEGNFDTVLIICQQAFDTRIQLGDSISAAKTLSKMANANYELGNIDEALDNNLVALRIFENSDLEVYTGRILANIGVIYERNGMYTEAIINYDKGLEIAEMNGNADAYYIALASKSTCLTKLGQYQEAEFGMQEALDYYLETGSIDHLGGIYQNLGFNARLNKQTDKGKLYYRKAYEMYQKNNSEIGMSLIQVNLGQLYMDEGAFDSAEVCLKEGVALSIKSHSFYQLMHAYKGLMRLENLKGNFQKADAYFDLYELQMDSLYGSETNTAIAEMQVKYDTEQKTKDLENEKLKSRNTKLWLLIAAIIIVFLILLSFFLNYRKRLQTEKIKVEGYRNVETERTRIARDLHDNLGAELALISSKIDIEIFKSDNVVFRSNLEAISNVSKNANHQLRETIWSIHKAEISVNDLKEKIEQFALRVIEGKHLNLDMTGSNLDVVLTPALALNVFRMSQEAINNSVKYVKTGTIHVELTPKSLIIQDHGNGFDVASVKRGYGLNNIEQRTQDIGGQFNLESDTNGTRLHIIF